MALFACVLSSLIFGDFHFSYTGGTVSSPTELSVML